MCEEYLVARLNDSEYANWLKAGRCLYILKDVLHSFTNEQMQGFHQALLRMNPSLREQCQRSCQSGDIKLSRACSPCLQWRSEILNHHRQPNSNLNWDNCIPSAWRTRHWELAKAYMPRGQGHVNAVDQCDPSALLNLINFCDCFASVNSYKNSSCVRELIRCRNYLMHSANQHVSDAWMIKFKLALQHFVRLFSEVRGMQLAENMINRMLAVDLSISFIDAVDCIREELATDSVIDDVTPELITKWEADLIREMLWELRQMAEDETMDSNQLKMLDNFLQKNKDLTAMFSPELQAISMLGGGQKKI
ncbi:uncharacterized protein CXorf38-like [Syngnathus acus]|uniref:uncharacterized protein CXorf38-like n=1 Tax=Syngnathus acus TaxID=161584 RepID=UPI0018860D86|nr:uncharacterized protein CXorf38-like [Syngnathus acus]XP_037131735.1 uncharacterized protein CXorf38-like [Syngnathus acus]